MKREIKVICITFILFLSCLMQTSFAQPATEWVQRYDSPGNYNDDLIDMVLDKYGNTYITGNTGNPLDIVTMKYSSGGELLWSRIYNDPANRNDEAVKIAVEDSGFVYVIGKTFDPLEFTNYLTIKYSSNGDIIWSREINNGDSTTDVPQDMILDDSSNIYITGSGYQCLLCHGDYMTIKCDKNGNLIWKKFYHGEGYFSNSGLVLALDNFNRVIVSGRSRDIINNAITATVIYDSNGDQLKVMLYDSSYVNNIKSDQYSNIYIGGFRRKNNVHNSDDIFVTKYDSSGNYGWSIIFDSPNALMNHSEYLRDMRIDNQSSNIYVTGYGDFNGQAGWEYPLLKYKTDNGDSVWKKFYSPLSNSSSGVEYMAIDKFNNIYLTGSSDYFTPFERFLTIKFDSAGNFIWSANYPNILFFNHYGKRIAVDSNNCVLVGGTSYGPESGSDDIVLIKYSQITDVQNPPSQIPKEMKLFQNYPNPFNPVTTIEYHLNISGFVKLSIFNLLGKEVEVLVSEKQDRGSYNIKWDAAEFPSGMYFYKFEVNGNAIDTKKLLLIK